MERRTFLIGSAGAPLESAFFGAAFADVPKPYSWDLAPPMDSRDAFVKWGVKTRGEDPKYLGERFDRFRILVANRDLWNDANKRAFL